MAVLTRNINVVWSSGGITAANATKTNGLDPHADAVRAFNNPQVIGTTAEDIDLNDVDPSNEYVVLLTNKDATNYVDVYVRKDATPTDTQVGRMRPGEPWGPVRMPAQSGGYPKLRCIANTASCNVEVVAGEMKPA